MITALITNLHEALQPATAAIIIGLLIVWFAAVAARHALHRPPSRPVVPGRTVADEIADRQRVMPVTRPAPPEDDQDDTDDLLCIARAVGIPGATRPEILARAHVLRIFHDEFSQPR